MVAIIISICLCILVCNFFRKNNNFLDVRIIVKNYFVLFSKCKGQCIIIWGVQIIISISIAIIQVIDSRLLNNLNVILSILITMLCSVLSILCVFNKYEKNVQYKQLKEQTFNTVLFEIILCIWLLLISLILLFVFKYNNVIGVKVFSGIIYYFTMIILLNFFMVLKRIKVLFEFE